LARSTLTPGAYTATLKVLEKTTLDWVQLAEVGEELCSLVQLMDILCVIYISSARASRLANEKAAALEYLRCLQSLY
jgi:hypothetical protein